MEAFYYKFSSDSLFYNTIFKYDFNIEIIWKAFSDVFITNKITKISTDTKMLKGPNSFTIGSEFTFKYFQIISIYFRVLNVINLPHYKKLVWKAYKSEPINVVYYFTYELYADPIDEITIMKWEILYEKNYDYYFNSSNKETNRKLKSDMLDILKIVNCDMEKNYPKSVNIESIIINANQVKVFELILDIKNLCIIIPEIADKVEYEGDYLKENSKFKFFYFEKIFYLRVNKITQDDRELKLEYECFDSNRKDLTPNQSIEWKVVMLSPNECLVAIIHKFKDKLLKKKIEDITNKKVLMLKKLKSYFEDQANYMNSNKINVDLNFMNNNQINNFNSEHNESKYKNEQEAKFYFDCFPVIK